MIEPDIQELASVAASRGVSKAVAENVILNFALNCVGKYQAMARMQSSVEAGAASSTDPMDSAFLGNMSQMLASSRFRTAQLAAGAGSSKAKAVCAMSSSAPSLASAMSTEQQLADSIVRLYLGSR